MISDYGWSPALGQNFAAFAARGWQAGRVTVQQRGAYILATDYGDLAGQTAGKLVHGAGEGDLPVIGDWVAIAPRPDEQAATIHAVLPRRTVFSRKAPGGQAGQIVAANVDLAFLVTSMNAEFNPRRLERYLALAWSSGARPVVVLTKSDVAVDAAAIVTAAKEIAIGMPVIAVSVVTGDGLETLAGQIRPGETCVLVGSSGVGKSSLVNVFADQARMETSAIRESDARGRHTTTHRELVLLAGGGLLLDTPGMRELGLIDAESGLSRAFDDIEALVATCRFRDCGHGNEPGCAIRGALATGQLDEARWHGFTKLQRELAFAARKEDRLARDAAHKRWIAITKDGRARRKMKGEF
jgi:ribosome biogenesis GTPase